MLVELRLYLLLPSPIPLVIGNTGRTWRLIPAPLPPRPPVRATFAARKMDRFRRWLFPCRNGDDCGHAGTDGTLLESLLEWQFCGVRNESDDRRLGGSPEVWYSESGDIVMFPKSKSTAQEGMSSAKLELETGSSTLSNVTDLTLLINLDTR